MPEDDPTAGEARLNRIELAPMSAVAIIEDSRILLFTNVKHGQRRVENPSGKAEPGETEEECAVRETFEELGVKISIERKLGDFDTDTPEGKFSVALFLATITEGVPTIQEPTKHEDLRWYSYAELLELQSQDLLVPDLCSALPCLKQLMTE